MEIEHEINNKEDVEKIMQGVDDKLGQLREDILRNLKMDKAFIDRIVLTARCHSARNMDLIESLVLNADKRWPINIILKNDSKGYKIEKQWMEDIKRSGDYPIIDHVRHLNELFERLNDRVLISQPYPFSKEDEDKLKEICEKNHLKYIKRDYSPYYPGAGLIIIYEDDEGVEDELFASLNLGWDRIG